MVTLTPAEEALLARSERVGALRIRLARLSREEFREFVDALSDDTPERIAARRSAEELALQLGRVDELEQAYRVLGIGAHDAGGAPARFRPIRSDADYHRINDADFYRAIRLEERARDAASTFIVGDQLDPAEIRELEFPVL